MEDTKSLLMMVLHKIFENQPKTIENTFQLIHNFNNGKIDKKNYEKTLKSICDLMNDELPSSILGYILTLVDMPEELGPIQSSLIEKMKKTHDYLPEINIRPHLLEFLNNSKPNKSRICENSENSFEKKKTVSPKSSPPRSRDFAKPKLLTKRSRKLIPKPLASVKPLLDICAVYVVNHEEELNNMYKKRLARAWHLINNDALTGSNRELCYAVVKDLNKKTKWLREIEANVPTDEILMEEYGNSDIFLKEKHIYEELNRDPFELPNEVLMEIEHMFD